MTSEVFFFFFFFFFFAHLTKQNNAKNCSFFSIIYMLNQTLLPSIIVSDVCACHSERFSISKRIVWYIAFSLCIKPEGFPVIHVSCHELQLDQALTMILLSYKRKGDLVTQIMRLQYIYIWKHSSFRGVSFLTIVCRKLHMSEVLLQLIRRRAEIQGSIFHLFLGFCLCTSQGSADCVAVCRTHLQMDHWFWTPVVFCSSSSSSACTCAPNTTQREKKMVQKVLVGFRLSKQKKGKSSSVLMFEIYLLWQSKRTTQATVISSSIPTTRETTFHLSVAQSEKLNTSGGCLNKLNKGSVNGKTKRGLTCTCFAIVIVIVILWKFIWKITMETVKTRNENAQSRQHRRDQ